MSKLRTLSMFLTALFLVSLSACASSPADNTLPTVPRSGVLTKTLTYPGLVSISYPGSWGVADENTKLKALFPVASAGPKGGQGGNGVGIKSGNEIGVTPLKNGLDPLKVAESIANGSRVEAIEIDGQPAAKVEVGHSGEQLHQIVVVILLREANTYVLIVIGTYSGDPGWNEMKPLALEMITTIRAIRVP